MRHVIRQGKPPEILDKAGAISRASARTDIAGVPALHVLGSTQRQRGLDINGLHVVTVFMQRVPKSKQLFPNTPSPVLDITTQSIIPI